jgi:hypothetical protein
VTEPKFTPNWQGAAVRLGEQLGGVKQRLGRDAADVEAGAAQRLPAFDAGGLKPQLRRPDRGHVSARSSADHDHVEMVSAILQSSVPGEGRAS